MPSNRFFIFIVSAIVCLIIQLPSQGSTGPAELIGLLTSQLGVTEKQAQGGAGSLFKIAKNSLSTENFSKISTTVPGMDLLLKAAPEIPKMKGVDNIASSLGGKSAGNLDMAGLPTMFGKLGMEGGMAAQFIPVVLSFVQSKEENTVMELLKGVWQKE